MSEVLDPSQAYLLLFTVLALAGAGLGVAGAAQAGVVGSAVLAGILGFAAGLYTSREETDLPGSLVLTGGVTALVVSFLPLAPTWGLAAFLTGFAAGLRSERH